MKSETAKVLLRWAGSLLILTSLVGVPFYLATAPKWEKVFGIGGIIGYLLLQCVVFLVPMPLAFLAKQGIIKAVRYLPKTTASVLFACALCIGLSFVPRWLAMGQAKGWCLLGMTTSCAIMVGVLIGGWQVYQAIKYYRDAGSE